MASTCLPAGAMAQSTTWNGGTGDFTVGGNWGSGAPGAGDEAIVTGGTATLNTTYTVDTLTVNGGLVEIVANAPGGALTASSGTTIGGGTLDIHNGGSLSGGTVVLNSGSLTSNGDINASVHVNYGMTFTQYSLGEVTGTLYLFDGTVNNAGTFNTVETHGSGTFNNQTGGTVTGTMTIESGGQVTNAGSLAVVDNLSGGTFTSSTGGTTTTLNNNGTATNTGTITTLNQQSGSFANNSGGVISGTTTLSGGTLSNAGNIATIIIQTGTSYTNGGTTGTVTNNAGGTFVNNGTATTVNNSGTGTNGASGTITTLNQIAGTFTNNSGGSISGTTTISGGTLTSAGTLGAVTNQSTGTFTNTGTAGAVTNSGTATNSGTVASLSQTAGTFTNNSGATVTGTTTISGGTVTNAGTLGTVNNQSGGTFTNSGTAGALTNAGTATNTGTIASLNHTSGTFTNSGSGTITGTVSIAGSTLINNGSSLGNIQVLNGGLLKGAGSFGTITISSGATIAPGNSIGTSRISGNLVFQSGSFYEVEVDPSGASDLITVTGSVTLNGGTVTVLAGNGTYKRSTEYQIITSGTGVTGRFASITSNLAFLDPTLVYRGNNVYLSLDRNDVDFDSIAYSGNQKSVGRTIDKGFAPTSVYNATVGLSAEGARSAFEDLSGDIYPSLSSVLLDDSHHLRDALTARMADDLTDSPFWLEGYGAWNRHFSDGNATQLTSGSGGILAGADSEIADGWRLGAAGGYGFTRASTTAASADADVNTYSASIYLEGELGPVSLRSGASYAFHDIDVDRYLGFGGLSQHLSGAFDAASRQVFAELGYGIDAGEVKLEPFANLAFVDYTSDALRETGGDAALNVSGGYDHAIYSLLGLRFSGDTMIDDLPVAFGGLVGWRHAHDSGSQTSRMNFAGKTGFDIAGLPVVEDEAVAELTASFKIAPSAAIELSWQGTFADQALGQRAGVRLGVSF